MDIRLYSNTDLHKKILVDFASNVFERNLNKKMQLIKTNIPTKYEILFDN